MIKQVFQIYNERGDFFIKLTLEHLKISGSAILLGAIIGLVLGVIISEYKKTSEDTELLREIRDLLKK